jgi:fructokinase
MTNILCIGEALIDMICTDADISLSQGENFLKKPGGAPTNVAAAIGALGGNVAIAAKVGNDPFGEQLIQCMQQFNVNTQYFFKAEQAFTTMAFVSLFKNGDRDFVFNRGADALLNQTETDTIDLKKFNIIHFGSATAFLDGPLQQAYSSVLQKAIAQNCFISFDPNYRQLLFQHKQEHFITQSWHYINHCHFFKVSDEEAMLLTKTNSVEAAANYFLQKTKAVFTITLGEKGALLGFNNNCYSIAAMPIKSIDSTGAGDAFVGAVLQQLSQQDNINVLTLENWKSIIAKANIVGAKTCEHYGAMEAFTQLKDLT